MILNIIMEENSKFYCNDCKTSYARKYLLSQHLKSRKHTTRIEHASSLCSCACGKSYTHKNSLEYHKKTCDFKPDSKEKHGLLSDLIFGKQSGGNITKELKNISKTYFNKKT